MNMFTFFLEVLGWRKIIKCVVYPGADWLPKFWWDFFSRGPQKKNYCTNKNAGLKKKKVCWGPPN
jgi:hypothetical protein